MPILKPSRNFVGSDIVGGTSGKYIKPEVPQVLFNKDNNKEGAYLYFLPAYKLDYNGEGIWYKVIEVRDNFGDKFKDKYVVLDKQHDPVEYFAKSHKLLYPDEAAVIEVDEGGRKGKKYPAYGRLTRRVVYNVAYVDKLEAGVHVLDLPSFNGASVINDYHKAPGVGGRERGLICDPTRCIPVFIKLKDNVGGNPWTINFESSEAAELPEQLCSSEYLHNLDEVFIKKDAKELIAKLAEMFPSDVFEDCMAGYPGFSKTKVAGAKLPNRVEKQAEEDEIPDVAPAKKVEQQSVKKAPAVLNIPKSKVPASGLKSAAPQLPEDKIIVDSDVNPVLGVDVQEAEDFLNS